MKVLQVHTTEMGDRLRIGLKKVHGIDSMLIQPETALEPEGFAFTRPHYSIYSYVRPSNSERVWIIEAEFYGPPDAQWWTSWVVDTEPTRDQVAIIIRNGVEAGSIL
jgi:hypothetical protein